MNQDFHLRDLRHQYKVLNQSKKLWYNEINSSSLRSVSLHYYNYNKLLF